MSVALGFSVGKNYYARELGLEPDRAAVRSLGLRCIEYLRQTTPVPCGTNDVLRRFLRLVDPASAQGKCGVLLGISGAAQAREEEPTPLVGALYFLCPRLDQCVWHIALLLLDPAARGQGIGSAVHGAFAEWAAARGARRLTVTVSETNRRALHFWRGRLRYAETGVTVRQPSAVPFRRSHNLEYRLPSACPPAPWARLKLA